MRFSMSMQLVTFVKPHITELAHKLVHFGVVLAVDCPYVSAEILPKAHLTALRTRHLVILVPCDCHLAVFLPDMFRQSELTGKLLSAVRTAFLGFVFGLVVIAEVVNVGEALSALFALVAGRSITELVDVSEMG